MSAAAGGRLGSIACWSLVGAWAIWAAIRLLGLDAAAPVVGLMAFTPYVALTAGIPLALTLVLRNWIAAGVAAVVAIALATAVLPRAFGGPTEAEGAAGQSLRVMTANMKLGDAKPEPLVELVRELDVDVLAVEELTAGLARRLDAEGLDQLLPHRELAPDAGSKGTGLYSRYPLGPATVHRPAGAFPLVTARVEVPGAPPLVTSAVHTTPPTVSSSAWSADLGDLPAAARGPLRVLAGDFNATLDHDEFRELLDRGYADAGSTLGEGLEPTWPADRRFPPLITIDHALADERIGIRDYAVEDLPGSDHRAVFAELELPAPQ